MNPIKKQEAKGRVLGLELSRVMFFSEASKLAGRGELGNCVNDLGNFLLLNPDFFFGVSGPAQKAVLVPFWVFWGGVFMI